MPKDKVWVPGQVMVGKTLSVLFTKNEQLLVLPLQSVAVSVTVVGDEPVTNVPAAGDCDTVTPAAVQHTSFLAVSLYAGRLTLHEEESTTL